MTAGASMAEAKRAMAAGNYAQAYEQLREIDLAEIEILSAVRVMVQMATCAQMLGRPAENIELHAGALARLTRELRLVPPAMTPEMTTLALSLAVGARDAPRAAEFIQILFGDLAPIKSGWRVSPVVPVTKWCRKNGIDVVPLDSIGPAAAAGNGTWYADIPGAEIVLGWDYVIAPSGEVLEGANYMPPDKSFPFMPHAFCPSGPAIAHVWPEDVVRMDVDALFLSVPERHHYGHWLIEFLPRLRAWSLSETPRRKLVVSSALPQKHRDLLARFGVAREDLIECTLGQRYAFGSLRVVRTGRANAPHPEDIRYLAAGLSPGEVAVRSKIYFLTRESGTRVPVNMDEVRAVLKAFGGTEINPARLTLAEQMNCLRNARAIIGAFGTELYCLFNLPPGAAVIELNWNEYEATIFGQTAALAGIVHRLIVCAKAEDRGAATYKRDGDLIVDCASLRAALAEL
ncbi:MAG: glycosyltransferase 61 family protein [Rhodospirillaceae bacterium]